MSQKGEPTYDTIALGCVSTNPRICACGCGDLLYGMRADALYRSEACKKRAQRASSGDKAGTVHPLDEARGQMREGRTSAQWELVAREKVARTLLDTGEFTADALADLNIPVDYRRHIHGAATGYFAGAEPFMDFVGRQKSARPSRKGAKNDLFRINAKGRRELPKMLRDLRTELQTLVGSCADTPGGVRVAESPASSHSVPHVGAASSQNNESVGLSAAAQLGGPAESGRSAEPGDLTLTAGQVSGKREKGRAHSSPAAGSETPDLSEPSLFDDMEEVA